MTAASREGGFSFVYKVTDSSGRGFALKKILAQSEELLEGGVREIEVLREFGGRRHILPLVDSCIKEVRPGVKELLLLLPCYERGTVEDALAAKELQRPQGGIEGGVPPEFFAEPDALLIFMGICNGLLEFHNHQPDALAHYDIKPGNVLMANDGRSVVVVVLGRTCATCFARHHHHRSGQSPPTHTHTPPLLPLCLPSPPPVCLPSPRSTTSVCSSPIASLTAFRTARP